MKKYLSPFVSGFGAGVLQVVPVAKSFACCFIIPLAAFISLVLEQKSKNDYSKIPMKKALLFGFLTGLYAAIFGSFFDVFITLITKNNDIIALLPELQKMVTSFPVSDEVRQEVLQLFQGVRDDIITYGFSALYTFSILINNFIVNSIFGIVGGLVGAQIINKRNQNQAE